MADYMHPSEWLREAENLSPGVKTKIPHPGCTTSNAMQIEHGEDGFSAYCFKCGAKGWKPHSATTMQDYLDRKAAIEARREAEQHRGIDLPADFSQEMPEVGALWLAKNGFNYQTCVEQHGMGWSEAMQRVIIPCYDFNKKYIGFTARAMYKNQGAKYIERLNSDSYPFIWSTNNLGINIRSICILTEDYLSAIRCSNVCTCMACMGTTVSAAAFKYIRRFATIAIWFDPDSAGRKGSFSIYKKFRTDKQQILIINSEKDPKHHTNRYIKEKLNVRQEIYIRKNA